MIKPPTNMIKLSNETTQIDIDLDKGGRIAQININGLNLLVPKEKNPLAWGAYPMVPWVGRLQHGKLNYQGKTHHFPLNMPPHAIHGTCFDRVWQQSSQQSSSQDLTHTEISTDLGEAWPFDGYAKQTITLNENSLDLSLSVHSKGNSEQDSFPASIGWHPWFNRQLARGDSAQLSFNANKRYRCDSEQIPSGGFSEQGPGPWDDCFIELDKPPVIVWENALKLKIESNCDHWVVYDMPQHALCVEPQTAAANALNTQPRVVTPDHPLCAQTTLSWQVL